MKAVPLHVLLPALLVSSRVLAADLIPAPQPEARPGSAAAEAVAAYRDGRRHAAVEMARPLAARGDADALFLMGFSLESLREPARLSRAQAMEFHYRTAEAAGHPEAAMRRKLVRLASGTEEERKECLETLESAAKGGDDDASRILGEAWLRGLADGKPDPAKAAAYWKDPAGSGDAPSLLLLARLHDGSFGIPAMKDSKAAAGYYRKAADLGETEALAPLAGLLLNGDISLRNEKEGRAIAAGALAAGDLRAWLILGDYETAAKNEATALENYRRGAEAGQPDCMLRLVRHALDGARDTAAGMDWLKKGADAGDPEAAAELGRHLLAAGSPETATAARYLLLAAAEGLPEAQHDLAMAYLEGKGGCPRDATAAMAWLTEAMKSGDAGIQYRLAVLHEEGIGGPVNYANAGVLYTLACNKGHAAAAARIARMAAEGLGTKQSTVQAWAHAALARERGDDSAKDLLAKLEAGLDASAKAAAEKALADLRAAAAAKAAASQGAPLPSGKP